jgi:hypothetical protein
LWWTWCCFSPTQMFFSIVWNKTETLSVIYGFNSRGKSFGTIFNFLNTYVCTLNHHRCMLSILLDHILIYVWIFIIVWQSIPPGIVFLPHKCSFLSCETKLKPFRSSMVLIQEGKASVPYLISCISIISFF